MATFCSSRIVAVELYARGAVVTREVEVPEIPTTGETLLVSGITRVAEPGSFRAEIHGKRAIGLLKANSVLPSHPPLPGDLHQEVAELKRQMESLRLERGLLQERVARLLAVRPVPRTLQVGARMVEALEGGALLSKVVGEMQEALRKVERDLSERQLQVEVLELKLRQRSERPLGAATWQVGIEVGAGGTVERLLLRYTVPCAGWWPSYSIRLGATAELAMDAWVVQSSEEDWSGVQISLSTGDLSSDLQLPTLPSLRLGRAQPRPRPSWRPPPPGLDRLFESHDRVFSRSTQTGVPTPTIAFPTMDYPLESMDAPEERATPSAPPPPLRAGIPAPKLGMAPRTRSAPATFGGGGSSEAWNVGAAPETVAPPEPSLEPTDAWMDYDRLRLGDARSSGSRGRLYRETARDFTPATSASLRMVLSTINSQWDPVRTRGQFAVRYNAGGQAVVPGDGVAHRIGILRGTAPRKLLLTAVPRESTEVFRSVELVNPLELPLLTGPVEVWLGGSLLATTVLGATDRGATIRVGMGVEERVRISRQVRVEEEKAGILGGSVAMVHTVLTEVLSSLGEEVTLQLQDILPVTDDRSLDVKRIRATPEPVQFFPTATPLRGGLAWNLQLSPGRKQLVELQYKLIYSGKQEIVGGGRREA